jgi:hypothetical protein
MEMHTSILGTLQNDKKEALITSLESYLDSIKNYMNK